MPRALPRRVLAVLGTGAVVLAGCGHTTAVGANRALEIRVTEYRLAPQSVVAHPGALSVFVRNVGRISHNLTLLDGTQTLASTKPIAPGQSAWLFVTLAAGSYTMASTMFSDQALGAYGSLTVRP